MRTRTWCVAAALVCLPRLARGPNCSFRSRRAGAAVGRQPARSRDPRRVDVARADVLAAGRWPNPRFTFDREVGRRRHREHVHGGAAAADHGPARLGGERGLRAGRGQRAARRRRDPPGARGTARRVRRPRGAQVREAEIAASRDRLRELAEILARREAAGDAAGFDRLRAEREVLDLEADGRRPGPIARARRPGWPASSRPRPTRPASSPSFRSRRDRAALPAVEALVARAEASLPELGGAAGRKSSPPFRDTRGRAAADSRAGNRRRHEVVEPGGRRHRQRVQRARHRPALRSCEAGTGAGQARALRPRRATAAFEASLRAQIAALRAVVIERREAADRYRASTAASATQIERIAQVSYDAGERGILELLDAYRTARAARVRQAALDAAVRQAEIELEFVSGWEIR